MELPEAKRLKIDGTLSGICSWSNDKAVVIEYHNVDKKTMLINYLELHKAQKLIGDFLQVYEPGEFIGIDFDVPIFCVPTLMLGINSAGHAFVCRPKTDNEATKNLSISYIFSKQIPDNCVVIQDFTIHNESLIFSKSQLKTEKVVKKINNKFTYVVTTSGSTGQPVVVRVTHASIIPNIIDLKKILNITNMDKISQLTPLTFDPSIIEIFIALSSGGTLFTVSPELKNNHQKLLSLIIKSKVTILQSTPSLLLHRWPLEKLKNSLLSVESKLKVLLLGGEPLPNPNVLFKFKHENNITKIYNIYGITEVSCWASISKVFQHTHPDSLGQTLSETIFQVRNEIDEIVDDGEGELFIGSHSRICLINDEESENCQGPVFRDTGDIVTIDKSGNIYYKGRKARCIKRLGNRVNLNVLDTHINQLDFIKTCCSIFLENDHSLHVFINAQQNLQDKKELYQLKVFDHLKKLPSFYHPDRVHFVSSLELTTNGKICLRSLKKKCLSLKSPHAFQGEQKNVDKFQSIWNYFLPSQDPNSRFLNVGGTSVIALQISNELQEKTGNDYPKLIGKMLTNETLQDCRNYVHQSSFNEGLNKVNKNSIESVEENKTVPLQKNELNSVEAEVKSIREKDQEDNCIWQKCRGKTTVHQPENEDKVLLENKPINIALEKRYDLLKCVDASPTIFKRSDGKTFATVGSHSGLVLTVNLDEIHGDDGPWKVEFPDRIEASVLVNDEFKGIVGCYDGFVYYFHLKTGQIIWKFGTADTVKCSAVFSSTRENVFFGSYDRHAYCISLKDGKVVWKIKLNGSISATPQVHKLTNSVLFGVLDGSCVSVDEKTGIINWKYKFNYPIFSAPTIVLNNLTVFADVSGNLECFDVATGTEKWSMEIDGNIFSHLVTQFNETTNTESIIVASKNKFIYNFEIDKKDTTKVPNLIYKINCESPIISTPWVDGNFITIVSINGDVRILDFKSGDTLTRYSLKADVYSSPVLHKNIIVLGSRDNNLWILSK